MEDHTSQEQGFGRKKLLINPDYQLSVMYHFLILFLTIMIVMVFAINWQLEPVIEQVKLSQLPENHPIMTSLSHFTVMMNSTVLGIIFFSFVMFIVMALIVSNKSAGPIYNLTQQLRKIRDNKHVDKVTFRKGDYFQELAEEINEFIAFTQDDKKIEHHDHETK